MKFIFVLLLLLCVPLSVPAQMRANTDSTAPLEVTAQDSLEWHEKEGAYVARGAAKAVRGDLTVEADTLTGYARKNASGADDIWRLVAEGNVRITTPRQKAFGGKAVYDVERQASVLTGAGLRFETGDDVVTAQESLEWWEADGLAVAKGAARATRPGRQVDADTLVAKLEEDKDGKLEVVRLDAEGNVTIRTETDVAIGTRASFDVGRNVAVLEGPVRIKREKGYLEGARAEVNFTTGQSRLIGDGQGRVRGLFLPGTAADTP